VPIAHPVAGIAMGLIKEGDDYIVLSDIAGVEDHLGDMDFKVAGTDNGITALQMDIKISGVTFDILRDALTQAKEGRTFILGKMNEVISETRPELSPYAPRITSIQIDPEKIGMVIGKGGETIRALSEEFDAQIDMQDDGTVLVYAASGEQGDALIERIRSMTKEVEVGDEFPSAKVVKTTTFGAFVELSKGTDGLLHISNISPGERAESVEDVLNRGDEVSVRVVEVDRERGRIGLRLADDPEIQGKSAEELAAVGTGDRGGRGDRPRADVRRLLGRARAMVLSSLSEGGANVISEAAVAGVPILATRIAGSLGILGADYPGYFEVGDAAGLAVLLDRCERDASFLGDLRRRTIALQPLVEPARERESWRALLAELLPGA